jgi:mersacidin/lichenicidin family type 2 lantibiotic
MSKLDIIRAWKDEEYCQILSADERSGLPNNPVGLIELDDQQLNGVEGGTISTPAGCPSFITICSWDRSACPILTVTVTITATADLEQ